MKIICDNCRTKYSIADEKVKGKVFKIRCKKCQNIIVVRGNEGDAAGAADDGAAEESFQAPEQAETKDSPVWHLVIGREQVGPMSGAEVRDRFGRGEIDVESYIWREGFADWQRLTAVPEFADLGQATAVVAPSQAAAPAPAAPAAQDWQGGGGGGAAWNAPADAGWAGSGASEDTARADAANLFGGSLGDPGRDLFASQHGQEAFSSAAAERAPVENNLFGAAPAPAGGDLFPAAGGGSNGGQQLFPSDDAAAAGGGGGADVQMTGQRHENSVLFSLTNLQALAMGGGRPVSASPSASPSPSLGAGSGSGGDGSGLIDIRAMSVPAPAGASLSSGMDDLPDLGGFSAPIATAPVLMPMAVTEERPKWILPTVFGVGGTLIVAVVVLLVVLVTRKPEPMQVVQAPVPVPVAGGAAIPPKSEAKPETKPETKPEAKADDKGSTENKAEDVKVARKGGKGKKGKKGGGGTLLAKADPVAEPAGKSTKGGGKKKGGDALDDLIDGAITGKKGGGGSTPKKAAAAAAPASNLPDALSRSDIQGGMRKIKDRVQGCYDKFRVPGTAFVTVTISQAGSVSAAKVKGMFAGTPTGACLQAAARSATFPRVKGPAITIDYPFILR